VKTQNVSTGQPDILVETTAHPRARKFVLDRDLNSGQPVTFRRVDECQHVPLAVALFGETGVAELHFAENVLVVLRERDMDWDALEPRVRVALAAHLGTHDPAMPRPVKTAEQAQRGGTEYLSVISDILDQTIRPYIHSHGGELDLVSYSPEDQRLSVSYVGTCGTCPAATDGTLQLIEAILRDEFDPRIKVDVLDQPGDQ